MKAAIVVFIYLKFFVSTTKQIINDAFCISTSRHLPSLLEVNFGFKLFLDFLVILCINMIVITSPYFYGCKHNIKQENLYYYCGEPKFANIKNTGCKV